MSILLISFLQNLWPFSRQLDDIKLSDRLVSKLSIPDRTKQFVFAIQNPKSQSIIYVLATQNLSKQSALDAELLIKEVRPEAVIAQVASSVLIDVQEEEKNNPRSNDIANNQDNCVPTSTFGVIKESFINKFDKEKYEYLAGNEVLKGIFGIGFYGHFLDARNAAKDVGSSILLLNDNELSDYVPPLLFSLFTGFMGKEKSENLGFGSSNLVPQSSGYLPSPSLKRLCLTNDLHLQTVRSVVSQSVSRLSSLSGSDVGFGVPQLDCDYQAPSYAQIVYPLLSDLHDMFATIPSIGNAMASAQTMLYKVDKGETVETQLLSEVRAFRVALEGMRLGLNQVARCPSNKLDKEISLKSEFSELSTEDKSHALFAKALQSQAHKFKSVVAVVDASSLAGLRKYWNTSLPPEIEDLIDKFLIEYEEKSVSETSDRKGLLSNKPVVAVGAGATAILGASSLSKLGPASTFMKLASIKVPASLKLALIQNQKAVAMAMGKTFGLSGTKTTTIMKATSSAGKIRTVAHSVIASAERTSFSTMRTAFYEIMRKRHVRPVGFLPWATFGCSVATCTGLLVYGDGIECAAESIPVAPRIACLGRGLQSLRQASQAVADSSNIQEAMESLMYSWKKAKGR